MKKVFLIQLIILLLCLFFFSSCIVGKFVKPQLKPSKLVITPQLDTISTCNLGEEMIKVGRGYYSDGIIIKSQAQASDAFRPLACQINEGFYEFIKTEGNYSYYFPVNKNQIIDYTADNMYRLEIRISGNGDLTVVREYGDVFSSEEFSNVEYDEVKSYFVLKDDAFQQTMIYIGKLGNNIKFSYREFHNNRIRDSFTTEITYDLSESNIIGYKGFRAEILEATNSKLIYKIISGF